MGDISVSYNRLLRELSRMYLSKKYSVNLKNIKKIESFIENNKETLKKDTMFYYYAGISVGNVLSDINYNGGGDDLNASIGGFTEFEYLIGARDNEKENDN